jgi:hypothetical protein
VGRLKEKMLGIPAKRAVSTSLRAAVFGAFFWLLSEFTQPPVADLLYGCGAGDCRYCADILYDRAQPVLAFCAALSFYFRRFFQSTGFRGILKIVAVAVLCFQIYTVLIIWSVASRQECTSLLRPRMFPMFLAVITSFLVSAVWAGICAAALIVYYKISASSSSVKEDFQKPNAD